MQRQYDKQEITRILGKFMTGETSLEEEKMLAQYFCTHEVGDEWQEYKEMFALFDNGEVDIEPDDASDQSFDADNEKVRMLPKAVNEKPKIISIMLLITGIAASVLLLLALHYKGNDVKPEIQPVVAQHTEQQDSTIKAEETHQMQEVPVVIQSTPTIQRHKKRLKRLQPRPTDISTAEDEALPLTAETIAPMAEKTMVSTNLPMRTIHIAPGHVVYVNNNSASQVPTTEMLTVSDMRMRGQRLTLEVKQKMQETNPF